MDTNANVKQLSTVSNPLALTYKGGYYVNKPEDRTGEYVSKEVAQEMLAALQELSGTVTSLQMLGVLDHLVDVKEEVQRVLFISCVAIHKATQP